MNCFKLSGYFDRNFGDDYMMRLFVRQMPEYEFVIPCETVFAEFLMQEPNVRFATASDADAPEILVIGSGFMVNSHEARWSEIKQFMKRKHPGDFCVGCNVEPFFDRLSEFLIRKKLEKFCLIICRDKKSELWLRKSVRKPIVKYLPDLLFSLPEEWIKKEPAAEMLGISVMNFGERAEVYYQSLAELADFYIRKTGGGVRLLAFDSGVENDVLACCRVQERMQETKVEIISHGTSDEILKAYAGCKKIIATRYHATVLAIRMGIDCYPIRYRQKTDALLEDLAYPIRGCSYQEIEQEAIREFLLGEALHFTVNEQILQSANRYAEVLKEFVSGRR